MLWYRQKKMAFCNHFCKEHTETQNTKFNNYVHRRKYLFILQNTFDVLKLAI